MGARALQLDPVARRIGHRVLAMAVAAIAQAAGALGGLERASEEARFDLRGAQPPDDVAVVAIDAKTFGDLREQWPFPRSLHGRVLRRLQRPGRARSSTTSSSPSPASRARTRPCTERSATSAEPSWPPARATATGDTQVLGGDDNLRAVRLTRRRLRPDQRQGLGHPLPARGGGAGHAGHRRRPARGRPAAPEPRPVRRRRRVDRLPRARAGTIPTVSFSDVLRGPLPRRGGPRPGGGGGRRGAHAARRPPHPGRRRADGRRRGAGQRHLDRDARGAPARARRRGSRSR